MRVDQNWTFCILGQWFCQHLRVKSKESQGYKFGSVKAFIKWLTCVNQKCLLGSLGCSQWGNYWNRPGLQDSVGGDFFSVHKYTNKTLKSIFTVYCILTVSININFSFILETKSSSFLVLNGQSISYQRPMNIPCSLLARLQH